MGPTDILTEENRLILAFFASEIARYLETGISRRLENIESRLGEIDAERETIEESKAVREILRLFSRYRLFRILRALSKCAGEGREFTKNSLIRLAGVGQGFRRDGLDRLMEILLSQGLVCEVGRKGRGMVYSTTSLGKRFLQAYVPGAHPASATSLDGPGRWSK
jgi:predicted transcriptional regulator